MKTNRKTPRTANPLHVLLVGNNPLDLSTTLEKINQVRGCRIITEIAFDLRSIIERLMKFNPNFILIDDNIGRMEMAQAVETLTRSRKTRHVPITVLKNSNYTEASPSFGVLDYLLKQNFSSESLYTAIKNSLRFQKTKDALLNAYRHRKKKIGMPSF